MSRIWANLIGMHADISGVSSLYQLLLAPWHLEP
jgi:hypothetical protein